MGHSRKHVPDEDSGFEQDDGVDESTDFGSSGDRSAAMIANAEYERARDEERVRQEERCRETTADDDDDDDNDVASIPKEETFMETVHREARERVQQWHDETWEALQMAHPPQSPPKRLSLLTRMWRSLFG